MISNNEPRACCRVWKVCRKGNVMMCRWRWGPTCHGEAWLDSGSISPPPHSGQVEERGREFPHLFVNTWRAVADPPSRQEGLIMRQRAATRSQTSRIVLAPDHHHHHGHPVKPSIHFSSQRVVLRTKKRKSFALLGFSACVLVWWWRRGVERLKQERNPVQCNANAHTALCPPHRFFSDSLHLLHVLYQPTIPLNSLIEKHFLCR